MPKEKEGRGVDEVQKNLWLSFRDFPGTDIFIVQSGVPGEIQALEKSHMSELFLNTCPLWPLSLTTLLLWLTEMKADGKRFREQGSSPDPMFS